MAKRLGFIIDEINNQIIEEEFEFVYYKGFAVTQKRKSIHSLHQSISQKYNFNILEISTKSPLEIGRRLSAFNLTVQFHGKKVAIENIFQSSKKFEYGGPFLDILDVPPNFVKKDKRLKESGNLLSFQLDNRNYPIKPETLFYDFIYCRAIKSNDIPLEYIKKYKIFTDIEFNHYKSINSQARAFAVYVYMYLNDCLDKLNNFNSFNDYYKNVLKIIKK